MKSSAMRDLMALTERPEVISLAGGWPDTSTFPPDSYAALMSTVASRSCARALQYGPTEGLGLVKNCVAQVMRSEGMEVDSGEVLVLEDNPYGLLRYEGSPLPTLRSLDDEFVIYASTFSKILSPGVRLGWSVAPAPVLEKMNIGKQASDLCSSSISQYFVGAYF